MVLAVPANPTRAAGIRLTAAIYQSDVTDAVNFLANPPDFVGTQTVAQSLANATWTAITLDSEQLDSYNGHSTSSNTSRYVCQVAGWYTVSGTVCFASNVSGPRGARIQVNGTAMEGLASFMQTVSAAADAGMTTPTRDVVLAVNDYVEVAGYQNSGGALNTAVDPDLSPGLWVRFSHA
jgi:hypothetical protein